MRLRFTGLFLTASLLCVVPAWSQRSLWGVTSSGVADNKGVIFKANEDGTGYSVQHNFVSDFPGASPYTTPALANGKLYGTTNAGGASDQGVLYEFDPATGDYTKKFDFSAATGTFPQSSLLLASNGLLYGMTVAGGLNDQGILYSYDPAGNVFTKKQDLASIGGANPVGSLVQAPDGKLYGMTPAGGSNAAGLIFDYDPAGNILTKRYDFVLASDGGSPQGSLVQSGTKLYGMTSAGGTQGKGTLFEFDPGTSAFARKIDFAGSTNGAMPYGSLFLATDAALYGMTTYGGDNNQGTLFKYDPATGTLTKKIDLSATLGYWPLGNLLQASNGLFYGLTLNGGDTNEGVLFVYDATLNTYTKKIDFTAASIGGNPLAGLVEAGGLLYGTVPFGGPANNGTLFQYNPTSAVLIKKIDFSNSTFGSNPQSGMVLAPNGYLYGMTYGGGAFSQGVLFEFDPAGLSYIKRVDFSAPINGSYPNGTLTVAADGKLYGMTTYGGQNGSGVLYEYDPGASFVTVKHNFSSATSGANPLGSLCLASNAKLYGMTSQGGAGGGEGVLFEYDPSTGSLVNKFVFAAAGANGVNPAGSLIQAANGKLYGMTNQGGTVGAGVFFEYNIVNGTFTKKLDFNNTNGSFPTNDLVQATNGRLYGMTYGGGANSEGVIFEYDPLLDQTTVKTSFEASTTGSYPKGNLMEVAPGKFYGMTSAGGTQDAGVLFEYDLAANSISDKMNLGGVNGAIPQFGSLALVPAKQSQTITFGTLPSKMFGDPDFTLSATASSGLTIIYTSSDPTIATVTGNTVHIVNFGTVNISASQWGNGNYSYAQDVVQPLVITRATQTITFAPLAAKTYLDPPFDLTATASSGLAVTFVSSDPTIASISGVTVTILKAGTVTITASQAGNAGYNPATDVPRTLVINKKDQTISFVPPSATTYGAGPVTLNASSSSGLGIVFTTADVPPLVSFAGNVATILGAGNATITATQPGNGNYNAAPADSKVLVIAKANQTITFPALSPVTYGAAPFTLPATSTSGLAISYASSDPTVASISGNTVTILKAGSTDITATQAGDVNYNAAPGVPPRTLVVNKANQTITFGPLGSRSTSDPPFNLTASASSGLTVTYSSSNPAVATVSGNTVTIQGIGSTTITASQSGGTNYNPASPVDQVLQITSKLSQTITFGTLPAKQFGDPPFAISATASSGLPVTFVSGNTNVATVSANTVTIVGAGTATITASQAGDATYNPALPVNQDLVVQKINQTISFSINSHVLGEAPFTISATASSGLPVTFTLLTPSKVSLSGNTVTILQAGSATIRGSQAGNSNYNAAVSVDAGFCIRPVKPTLTQTNPTSPTPLLTSSSPTNNIWLYGGNVVAGANNQTYTPTKSGLYSVIIAIEGCFSDASDPQTVALITGDLPDPVYTFNVYPNPAKAKLMVDLRDFATEPVDLKITDLNGSVVLQQKSQGGNVVEIGVVGHAPGIYLLIGSQAGRLARVKYVKE
jgi:uncharacterized repeat protein (TIGR03803 family)